ncbi:alpha-glucan phosphorylase [Candidatus Poribacteria bacterium]|nr:alpha-glucan phosphorylase [Candidatus Poribacteria bacterium]
MKPIRSYRSIPSIPDELDGLRELAGSFWWHWNHSTTALFRDIDPATWSETNHNPVAMLSRLSREQLDALARNDAFRSRLRREVDRHAEYVARPPWLGASATAEDADTTVAYFCAEYGIAEFFRIYSGGLGVLAGDHLKAASDLGVPLVAVGLFYHRGYFQQRLTPDGWQLEAYPYNDPTQLPMTELRDGDRPLRLSLTVGGAEVHVGAWRADVGRTALYLLDTNIEENPTHLRAITDRLYGGDEDHRLRQELVLGIGGVRLLDALGHSPTVFHINEGHAAFLTVERVRQYVAAGMGIGAAFEIVRSSNAFTTHTPVPAGNRVYEQELVRLHMKPYLDEIGASWSDFLALGQVTRGEGGFGMTTFALRSSAAANGVSRLHGAVSREMWHKAWGETPVDEAPISHVTNGVHTPTWVGREVADLYDLYVGPRWRAAPHEPNTWERVASIPDAEMWRGHVRARERLVTFAQRDCARGLKARRAPTSEIREAASILDPRALTIGFARRAATYKRLTMLLRNPDRLRALLTDPDRPVQFLIAGKAHPDDHGGKEEIQRVVRFAQDAGVHRSVVYIENYSIHVGRLMTAGVDVWLNTPRRPHEASGTSGMKAAMNGIPNLSVLDGWWAEAYEDLRDAGRDPVGWAIDGTAEGAAADDDLDAQDADTLYGILEREVVPEFYDRDSHDVPRAWVGRMKRSVRELAHVFSSHRMVADYVERAYLPLARRRRYLEADGARVARELAAWKARVRAAWGDVRIVDAAIDTPESVEAGSPLDARVSLDLGGLDAADVRVEVAVGKMDIVDIHAPLEGVAYTQLACRGVPGNAGDVLFEGEFSSTLSGHLGVTVRVTPSHADMATPVEMGLALWA